MQSIKNLGECVRYIRKEVNTSMSIQQLDVLLTVVINDGITQPEISESLSMPQGTVSKNIKVLSLRMVKEGDKYVKKGLELVTVRPDLYDPKKQAVFITDKGKKLMEKLSKILEKEF